MNTEQIRAAFQLLALMDGDAIAQADANSYGQWYRNLSDQLAELMAERVAAHRSGPLLPGEVR